MAFQQRSKGIPRVVTNDGININMIFTIESPIVFHINCVIQTWLSHNYFVIYYDIVNTLNTK